MSMEVPENNAATAVLEGTFGDTLRPEHSSGSSTITAVHCISESDAVNAPRATLRDWLLSLVHSLDAANAVLRPLEADRGYSISTFIAMYFNVFQSEIEVRVKPRTVAF